ncbi:hypothetical protein TAFFO16_5 [Bacillus phage Taffo16]|uniref:Uncharacterized protein n=1 Tax=Bacillus phage Taffo16 TaxID=2030094 RepID=A0A249XUU5_9CAUD|nr:hypothetical protein TAFFO16_5 [Bacillus phage Taffo16]ULF48626.1 membrane protein [Bacillus phage BillyBob]
MFNLSVGIIMWGFFLHHVYHREAGDSVWGIFVLAFLASLHTFVSVISL